MQKTYTLFVLIFLSLVMVLSIAAEEEEISKPLLRVWPTFRPEECEDWAISPFICKRCLWEGKQYAQKIFFYESGPYRLHGCYFEPEGFLPFDGKK